MNTTEALSNEVQQLEQALAQSDLDPVAQVAMRERHALVSTRLADLESRAEFAEVSSEDLRGLLEDGELRREELFPELQAALADRVTRPALARKLQREYDDLAQNQAGLRAELDTRQFQEVNDILSRNRASVVAEREIDQADGEALEGLETWRREKAREQLAISRDRRIEKHTALVHERLLTDADAKVGAQLLMPGHHEPTEMPVEESPEESAEEAG